MAENKGYIAITSAVIISALLLTIAVAVSFTSYLSRFNVLSVYFKERSYALAEACAEKALLNLTLDNNYAGNESIAVSSEESCNILPIELLGNQKIIKTTASSSGVISNIRVRVIFPAPLTIVSWEEVDSF